MIKICGICNKEFELEHPNQRYCSSICRITADKQFTKKRVNKFIKNNPERWKEINQENVDRFRERWSIVLKKYRYEAIGKAYEEHGSLMNQYFTGKGTNNFGPHCNPDPDTELVLVRREKKRRGLKPNTF